MASWCFMVPWIFFEKLGCFFQDEARFLWGDVIFWDYWTLLPIAQWFRTKTLYIFMQLPARIPPRFVPTFIYNILTYVSFMGPTSSVFPGLFSTKKVSIQYIFCQKLTMIWKASMEPAVGVSPLHVGVTLATNRPTWKSTMVATWRAAGCVPAYRDGQVDYGMGRRNTERTGAGFLSFFFFSGEGFVGSAIFFLLLCVLWWLTGARDFAALPMDFNCVDQVCWFSLFLLMCGTLEMANDFSSHLHFATWWLSSFKHFLPQIPPKHDWCDWHAGFVSKNIFFPYLLPI